MPKPPTLPFIFNIVEIVLSFMSKLLLLALAFYLTPCTTPCLSSQESPLETILGTKTLEPPLQTVIVENQRFWLTHLPNVTLLILLHQPAFQLQK